VRSRQDASAEADAPGPLVAAGEADVARLRDRLAEIEAEHAMLEAELAVFEADYTREVVTVLAQLHDVEARILALVAERSGAEGDAAAAGEADARARRTTTAARALAPAPDPVPPAALKRAFRDAAKRMHPDLAPSEEARGHAGAFMKRLNDAYRAGDAEAIADLVRQWDGSPFAAGPAGGEGARRLAGLQSAVARAQRRLDELRGSELARMMERAMAAAAAGEDHVATLRAHAELALADARARLAALAA
jgi:hypothetical protein